MTVIGEIRAGDIFRNHISSGTAAMMMTDTSLPPDVDSVIPVEFTERNHQKVFSSFIRFVRVETFDLLEKILNKQRLYSKHDYLNAGRIAILSSIGYTPVRIYRTPAIGFLASGNE